MKKLLIVLVIGVGLGLLIAFGLGLTGLSVDSKQQSASKKEPLYWVAPMDPNYRRDKPGKSPMGMDLIPVYEEGDAAADESAITINPAVINNLGVRIAKVMHGPIMRQISTVGNVDYDETKITHIHLRIEGWIEQLTINTEGERVKQGQLLFKLYSPDLVNAQEEYVQALRSGNQRLINASKERLSALGLARSQIDALRKNRKVKQVIDFYAPQSGIVAKLNVREGMHIKPSTVIMEIVDLSTVWLNAEVFESQANWVEVGQQATAQLPHMPGKIWQGRIQYIYPHLDLKTRTLKVRLQFDNPNESLKPNMYAQVFIDADGDKQALRIPREALIRTAERSRVILALGDGQFRAHEVKTGLENNDWVEIISGLKEGDNIVTSAQFLIDSEASLKASLSRMEAPQSLHHHSHGGQHD